MLAWFGLLRSNKGLTLTLVSQDSGFPMLFGFRISKHVSGVSLFLPKAK